MNAKEAIEYIHSIGWQKANPTLDRITELCGRLGNPQDGLKFIHVTGTNGKGSACAMTESILRHAGYKTGLFISPYIRIFNERIQISGVPASDELIAKATEEVKKHAEQMSESPTEFELLSAIAFLIFKWERCDIIVLEVGMGGSLDSTNVIKAPVLSVITGVSLDHTAILGDTVEKIAKEKAGIIKPSCPVLYGNKNEGSVADIIRKKAEENNAPIYFCDKDGVEVERADLDGSVITFGAHKSVKIPLLGLYQTENAARVLKITDILNDCGFDISEKAIRNGLQNVRWQARFEKLSVSPLVLYDGSHNPEGIDAAVKTLSHYFGNEKINILTGVMSDKDYSEMARKLAPFADTVYTVTPSTPRSLPSAELADVYRRFGASAFDCKTVENGYKTAFEDSKKRNKALVCLGSLYMYSEFCDAMGI